VVEVYAAADRLDDVRAVLRRRNLDDRGIRLALESAQSGGAWLARDDAEAIGIAVAHDSENERYLGDLFVEASYRGHGIAAQLLRAAFEEASDRAHTMLLDPAEPASIALAVRWSLAPRDTLVRAAGAIPKEEELAKMAVGDYRFLVETIDAERHIFGLNELDRRTRGTARPDDHARFAQSATGNAFFLSGECVGYAYVWPDGRIGPIACASEAYLVQIFSYALLTLGRTYDASWCTLLVPGANRRIARASLRAGLRVQEVFLVAADTAHLDLSAYVADHRLLL